MTMQTPFKWRHFQADIILICLRYALSYRDLEEIMLKRGLHVDHITISLGSEVCPRTLEALPTVSQSLQ